jgi:uncharacterized protein (TIGR02246 family)
MLRRTLFALIVALCCFAGPAEDEAAIRELEAKWDAANLSGDAEVLDKLFADKFIMTADDGTVREKAEVISALRARRISYSSAHSDEVRVILHGDTAIVSGRWTGSFTHNGKTTNLRERFTNVYVRLSGQWRVVASHGSNIRVAPAAAGV